jgi:hypothetical protein
MSHRPSAACESNAIVRSSGDQRGDPWWRPGPRVSRVTAVPSALASQTSVRSFDRSEENAIRRPSREYCGLVSKNADVMSGAATAFGSKG